MGIAITRKRPFQAPSLPMELVVCINFRPVGRDSLRQQFNLSLGEAEWPEEVWQDYLAPIIRCGDAPGNLEANLATFGMIPKSEIKGGKRYTTMNARIETVSELRSYSQAWAKTQFCLIPMTAFYEPHYSGEKSVRWKISEKKGEAFCVAGLWRLWPNREGVTPYSFTMLTTNADNHGFLNQFHKPGDEKRSLIIIPPTQYSSWLECESHEDLMRLLHLMPEEWYIGCPEPVPPRVKKANAAT